MNDFGCASRFMSQEYLDQLKEKWSPAGSKIRNVQDELLEVMIFLDKVCKENNIEYFLDGGSALGAIRHNGFIPWDDDMDIALCESEYKKLIRVLLNLDSEKYVLQCQKTDFNYINFFPKFRIRKGNYVGSSPRRGRLYKYRGAGVDIFCFQRNSYLAAKLSSIVSYRLLSWTCRIESDKLRYVLTKLMYGLSKCMLQFFKIFNLFRKEGELHNALGQGWAHLYINESDVKSTIRVPFEHLLLPVPYNYDSFLKSLFGDYMRIPSEREIVNNGFHQKDLI